MIQALEMESSVTRASTIRASEAMADALTQRQERRAAQLAQQELERQHRDREQAKREVARDRAKEVQRGINDTVDTARAHGAEPGDIEQPANGPTRILNRDGLLWLIAKKRLNQAQRDAAERYRADFTIVEGGSLRSCIDDRIGGGGGLAVETITHARWRLKDAREIGLVRDPGFIGIMDAVAGLGTTLRELANSDAYKTTTLEVEFRIACRLLARHYGLAT